MASKYTIRGEADMSRHDQQLKNSAAEVYKYEKSVKNAQAELKNFNNSVNGSINGIKGLADAFKSGNFANFGTSLSGVASSISGLVPAMGGASAAAGGMGAAFTAALGPVGLITAAIAGVGAVVVGSIKSVSEFENHLDSLQSLTGLSDDVMKEIGDGAIDMSKNFKSSASEIVDSMKLIGSQAPELLKDKDALMATTEAANVLSEAAGIEVVDAAKGITTVMNQMGVSAANATDIINVLAAASQQGSADVAYLNTAFEKSGTAASSAGLSYSQLAAMVETVAPKFSSADVAGSQLASTLLALSVQTEDKFKPAVVGLDNAIKNLADAELTDKEMKDLVGASNINMLKTLVQGQQTLKDYESSLVGTNTAYEQMAINNDNLDGSITKLKSSWDAFLLTLGESAIIQGIIDWAKEAIDIFNVVVEAISDITKEFSNLGDNGLDISQALTLNLKVIKVAVEALAEAFKVATAIIVRLFKWMVDNLKSLWNGFEGMLKNLGIYEPIKNAWRAMVSWFTNMVNKLKDLWNEFKKWLGMDVAEAKITVSNDIGGSVSSGSSNAGSSSTTSQPTGGGSSSGSKSGSAKVPKVSTTKAVVEPDEGSIKAYQSKLSKLNDELNNTNVSDDRLKEILAEKKALEDTIEQLQIRNGLKAPKEEPQVKVEPVVQEGSLKAIQDKLSKLNAELQITAVGTERYYELTKEIGELTEKEHEVKIKVDSDSLGEAASKAKKTTKQLKKLGDTADVIDSMGSSFSALGEAIGVPELDAAGIIAGGIASVISGYGTATAQASSMGPWAWIAFALAGAATMASVIAQINSLSGHAGGGIIDGKTTIGDYNLARVNAGEMILNNSQQGRLFAALNGVGSFDNGGVSSGNVQFRIQGNDLVGVLNNYNKKRSKAI